MERETSWERDSEWGAVKALLAREALTEMGKERASAAAPLTDPSAVQSAIELTREARLGAASAGPLPLQSIPDIRLALEACRVPGSVLDGAELVQIIPVLEAGPRLIAYGKSIRPIAPWIAAITDSLPRAPDLTDQLRRSLDADGAVTDEASPRLKTLRREIRDKQRRLTGLLEKAFQSANADRLYSDRYVTIRHGRYVLPVRAEARASLRGIVHDRSQSGQTLFIEPEYAVDANNDLVQAIREEEYETARVLAELTDGVRERLEDLERLVDLIAELDWIFARAGLAERMVAAPPIIDLERSVSLRGARHPLLLAQSWSRPDRPVVPMDIELGPDRPLLVITGPNAGGKTVALKTLALLSLMTQVGCHVPADEGSRLPVFPMVYAIIGDDQSVAENLSTFSAFVKQIKEILERADDRSLVLLDELGAGTDPDEGAALAQAILEELDTRGALVMATTHLEPLKVFASSYPRARNASVEFDERTLAPTFRLRYDQPGQSYALTIAARLGLGPELITRANAHRSAESARLGDLLAKLDAHARSEADARREIEQARDEALARLASAREAEAGAKHRAGSILARAKAEAEALLTEIRRAVNAEWEKLKSTERSRKSLEGSRKRLRESASRIEPSAPEPARDDPAQLHTGATVAAEHLGVRGELIAIEGSTATVRSGSVTVRIPAQALRVVTGSAPSVRQTSVRLPEKTAVGTELHLIGQTTDEARDRLEKYLDDVFLAGLASVRIIHGKGSGALRKAVRDLLSSHPLVDSFRDGELREGGAGATVVTLKLT